MHTTKTIRVVYSLILLVLLVGCSQVLPASDDTAPTEANTQTVVTTKEVAVQPPVPNQLPSTSSGNDTQPELVEGVGGSERLPKEVAVEQVDALPTENRATDENVQSTANVDETSSKDGPPIEPIMLAGTNIAQHSVPLDEVHFDTFNGSYVALSDADEATVLQLRNAIPPVETPVYENVKTADRWLADHDIVIGYVDGDEALAYPARIMNYHEIVNETVNDIPVLISFCPLCNSGIVYDRRLAGEVLEFGNTSALYNSDMVMYDKQTFSYWFQVGGDAIVGDLTGQRLEVLPTRFLRWDAWREAYPDSKILSRDTGFQRPYERDPFTQLSGYLNQGRFPFPVNDEARNPALPAGEQVISVVINDEAKAYPTADLAGTVINNEVGNTPVAVIVDEAGTGIVVNRQVGEQILTFNWNDDVLTDEETGSQWTLSGKAVSGPLAGEQLELIPGRFSFWFAFVAAFPQATAYTP